MDAILELIKTLIPFGIAFLFLWGIGRICCTNNTKPKPQAGKDSKQKKSNNKNKKPKSSGDSHADKVEKELSSGSFKDMMNKQRSNKRKDSSNTGSEEQISELDSVLKLSVGKQRKLKPIQKAYLLKEILDPPKGIKPYRSRYPR
ncbi:hypothetical protein [Shimazuella kribbensis]|uniref:hypothetical protein n=1 Tax=Shimazuella kribbensis TaxID=139808 RepID=UPI00041FC392|nr:hypothetical protein [Shimazuella kribbensis]